MDPLVGLGDDRADAEQGRTLGRPVTRRTRTVLLAGEDHQRHSIGGVLLRRVVDRQLLAVGQVPGDPALGAGSQHVAQPDVGERPADHHLVVAAPGPVGVEVRRLHPVLHEVAARG